MSSTKRSKKLRHPHDQYFTPPWMTEAIVPELRSRFNAQAISSPKIYEPACGSGQMVNVLARSFPGSCIDATDLLGNPSVDFTTKPAQPKYDLIITNPPFYLAIEFVEQAMKWRKNEDSIVAMLLRLNFLGSRTRGPWLRENLPSVYVSPARPSFQEDGHTDSIEYAWYIWQAPFRETAKIDILHTEHIKIPRKKKTIRLIP